MEEGPRVTVLPPTSALTCAVSWTGDWARRFGHPGIRVGSWVIAQPL